MAKVSKRVAAFQAKVDRNKFYPIDEALSLVKEFATAKFDESIDVAVQLGIDAKKSDQVVRGSVVLPEGTGKSVRVRFLLKVKKLNKLKPLAQKLLAWKI
jgi:large subunit ribosomal protein L1